MHCEINGIYPEWTVMGDGSPSYNKRGKALLQVPSLVRYWRGIRNLFALGIVKKWNLSALEIVEKWNLFALEQRNEAENLLIIKVMGDGSPSYRW